MVTQNPLSRSSSRRRPRKAAGQPKAANRRSPPIRVICAHCGKSLSRSTAYRHELNWNASIDAAIAAANPLPYNYPAASPPSSPFIAHPSSDEDGQSVSSFHSSELEQEGLRRRDVAIRPLGINLAVYTVQADSHSNDDRDDLGYSNADQVDNDVNSNHPGPDDYDHQDDQDIDMQDGEDDANADQDGNLDDWHGLGDADGFGAEGYAAGEMDDDGCDGTANQQGRSVDVEDVRGNVNPDEESPDPSYRGSSATPSGTSSEDTSEVTDEDEFAVRRWSDEEDPKPEQPGVSYHHHPLQPIGTNTEVIVGRDCKWLHSPLMLA